MLIFAIFIYALAMTAANFSVFIFGPWVSPINAFFLIGLDLSLRDWLHVRMSPFKMGALILASGFLTFALNNAAAQIAMASAVSFTLAATVDWFVFSRSRGSWLMRSYRSNIAGAAVDSAVFPTIAFGSFMPHIVLLQFAAKVAGGALWALIINRHYTSRKALAWATPRSRTP